MNFFETNLRKIFDNVEGIENTKYIGRTCIADIGGGKVMITELDGFPVEISGTYPTIIDTHMDQPGVIHMITGVLVDYGVNIAGMKVFRQEKNTVAYMIIETDQCVSEAALAEIRDMQPVLDVKFVKPF